MAEQESLAGSGRAVVEGGVRHVEPGHLNPQALEFEQGPQHALAGLGLIGCVRRVELAPRDDRVDGGGRIPRTDSSAEETREFGERLVPFEQPVNLRHHFGFLPSRADAHPADPSALRNVGEQLVGRSDAERLEKCGLLTRFVRNPTRQRSSPRHPN